MFTYFRTLHLLFFTNVLHKQKVETMNKKFIHLSKNDDNEQSNSYWNHCISNKIPFITITNKRKYSNISYDLLPCKGIFNGFSELTTAIQSLYHIYALNKNVKEYLFAGGSSAAGFNVYKEDAEELANLLFDFITQYIMLANLEE